MRRGGLRIALRTGAGGQRSGASLVLLLALGACCGVEITPAALHEPGGRAAERSQALARWEQAVGLMNDFLASPLRLTLPVGRFALENDGLVYATDAGNWRIGIFGTWWGDLVVATGFRAQEDADGFVVGSIDEQPGEEEDELLDNTFFRFEDGAWHDAASLAEVILHETTHVVYREGTVGAWNTVWFYVVAVATFSGADHPVEDRPRATSEEFRWYERLQDAAPAGRAAWERAWREHLAEPQDGCEHGPFPSPEGAQPD